MSVRKIIAVIGDGDLEEGSGKYRLAENLGRSLIDHGYQLVTGGLGGVMEAASKGAGSSALYNKGDVIGILPGDDPAAANPYVDTCIPTGFGHGRNMIISHADAVVAIGGGAGTLGEMAHAWALGRLIVAYRVEGWSGNLADRKIDSRDRYPALPCDRVYGVTSETEVIEWLNLLPEYTRQDTIRSPRLD